MPPGSATLADAPAASSVWAHLPPPPAGLAGIVVIPARDEAATIAAALQALLPQIAAAPMPIELLVLANNCCDRTAEVVRETAARHGAGFVHVGEIVLGNDIAGVGVARRLLMEQAATRLCGHPDGLIFSTDADTRAEPGWLAATLREFEQGADAVGGRILSLATAGQPAGIVHLQRLDAVYRLMRSKLEGLVDPDPADPWPRHHQHFGASLAVRTSALARVGGLPHVPHLEDEALVAALRREDCRVRHSPRVRVWTSGRLDGRAEVGLSWQLRRWQQGLDAGTPPVVRDPRCDLAVWRWRHALRTAWQARATLLALPPLLDDIAGRPAWPGPSLDATIRSAPTFGRLWEHVADAVTMAGGDDELPIGRAITELRRLLAAA